MCAYMSENNNEGIYMYSRMVYMQNLDHCITYCIITVPVVVVVVVGGERSSASSLLASVS